MPLQFLFRIFYVMQSIQPIISYYSVSVLWEAKDFLIMLVSCHPHWSHLLDGEAINRELEISFEILLNEHDIYPDSYSFTNNRQLFTITKNIFWYQTKVMRLSSSIQYLFYKNQMKFIGYYFGLVLNVFLFLFPQ